MEGYFGEKDVKGSGGSTGKAGGGKYEEQTGEIIFNKSTLFPKNLTLVYS